MKTFLFSLIVTTSALANFSPVPDDENVALLLEGKREIVSLTQMTKLGLNQGTTDLDLWSGSYWPLYQGSLGLRYRDPNFIGLIKKNEQFGKHEELKDRLPLYTYSGRENLLSPAEKYDLLVGDSEMSLTKYAWDVSRKAAIDGKVKTWRGICDGWASASQKMPRPTKNVTLNTPAGIPLTFFPEDIKALGSLMYARSQAPVIFLGKRCRSAALGLFTDACDETNPGTFHSALVNRVGAMKKSFIADISPGGEVWNYPVDSYNVTFYNVFDDSESQNFEEVKELYIKRNRFSKSGRRHKATHSIVGVKLNVNYRDMRAANLLETDSIKDDATLGKTYIYDLELDAYNNILGGESHSKNLPDFIWAPNDKTYPLSDAEELNPGGNLIELSKAASKSGQPLSRVIERLFELAK